MLECRYPPPVRRGDTVAVVAPSHAPPDRGLREAVDRLESLGLDVRVYDTATRSTEWLRDHPDARARDVERAFADDEVRGVVAAMGGNTAADLLGRVDRDVLREHPTRFFGGSDNTHLHLACNRAGLVSFYGGQAFPDLAADPEMRGYTRRTVTRALRATPFGRVRPAAEWTDEYYDLAADAPRTWFSAEPWRWRGFDGRTVEAPIVGGCLSMLRQQLAMDADEFTPAAADGCVLAVETSGETPPPEAVERFFVALGERGMLDAAAGLLVAKPETPAETPRERRAYRDAQREAIIEVLADYAPDLPAVFDPDFGHPAPVLPLPLGARVRIDGDARTLTFT